MWNEIMEQPQPALNTIVVGLIGLAATVITGAIRNMTKKANAYYESHTTVAQREFLNKVASEAFSYAEQVYKEYEEDRKAGSLKLCF